MPCKVGRTQPTQYSAARRFGYSSSIQDARGAPLITIVYATEAESQQAEDAVRKAIENAVEVSAH
jgi:hypothetical protein